MIRGWRAAVLSALMLPLAACTSGGTSPAERLGPQIFDSIFGGDADGEAGEVGGEVPRSVLLQIPFATIAIQETEDGPLGYAIAQEANGPYVVYGDSARRSVTILGGLVTGTSGIGRNLAAVKNQIDDPIAVLTPLADWPERVDRNYQFVLRSAKDFDITVNCRFLPVTQEQIIITEIRYDVTRVSEICSNGYRTFQNVHWVDAETGFLWKTKQWVGPKVAPYTVQILRPFDG